MPSYAIMTAVGLAFSLLFLYFRSYKFNISFKQLLLIVVFGGVGLIVGSKVLYFLTQLPIIISRFSFEIIINTLIFGGIVFYGGMLGALLGIRIYALCKNKNAINIFNFVIPAFPLFHIFGRIGCFLGGCCYGKPASWGFAMYSNPEVLRIPVQLFESGCNTIIFIVLLIYEKRSKKANLIVVYLLLYSMCRFILEFFRDDEIRGVWGVLSTSQLIAIAIVLSIAICKIINYFKILKSNKLTN
jgi:phosphatidylglycerol:prolipoprotein diacylglycerol transferase